MENVNKKRRKYVNTSFLDHVKQRWNLKNTITVRCHKCCVFCIYCYDRIGERKVDSRLLMNNTWNTVNTDCRNVSKWLRVSSLTSENLPPKICIPNNENIKMKRNKITSSEFIDDIEFTSDLTKLPKDDQYLKHTAFNAM